MVRLKVHFSGLARWLRGEKCWLHKPDYPDSIPGTQGRRKELSHKICVCTCAYVCVCICMSAYVCVFMCTCVCAFVHECVHV